MGTNYSPKSVKDGLVLHLDAANKKSYPGSGTTWLDLSGRGNNATLTNGPTYDLNNVGSIQFDGTNDYATAASSSSFAFGTGDFTLEVWIRSESTASFMHMIALPSQGTFALKANVSDRAIYYYDPSYTTYGSTPGWTLPSNIWCQVVFKRQTSVGHAYLNGELKGTKSGFNTNFIAQTLNIHNGWSTEFSQCKMSNIKIYNMALTDIQIKQNFNALRGRYDV